eukprot:scaffold45897_cov24-Tisochrysis_lutea.AAC.1
MRPCWRTSSPQTLSYVLHMQQPARKRRRKPRCLCPLPAGYKLAKQARATRCIVSGAVFSS